MVREYDYIRGNTAIAPERKRWEEKSKDANKRKREEYKRRKLEKKQNFNTVMITALILTALGGTILALDSYVYKTQKDLISLEKSYREQLSVNEAIKVDLMKYSSLDNISNIAEHQIGMVYPDKSSAVTIDMSKKYFEHIKEDNNMNKSTNFIENILKIFKR